MVEVPDGAPRAVGGGLSGIFVALGVGLIGFVVGSSYGGSEGARLGAVYGLATGLVVGLFVGILHFGAMVLIQHYLLRVVMARGHLLPFQLESYLDAMSQRRFLLRAGSHYRFLHDTFQDYISLLNWEDNGQLVIPGA